MEIDSAGISGLRYHAAMSTLDERSWSDEHNRQELQKVLFSLNERELFEVGITQAADETSPPMWLVAYSGDADAEHDAIIGTLKANEIQCLGSCSRGSCGWYVHRESFFAARKALLDSAEVNKLHIRVVTPVIRQCTPSSTAGDERRG